jgi:hypothetical protein
MVEVTLPIILQLIQTFALLVAIVYYITIMRNQQKTRELSLQAQEHATETRQAQLFMQIYDKWSNPEFTEAFTLINQAEFESVDEINELYDIEEYRRAWGRVVGFYEGVGVLVKEGLVDIRLVALLMTGTTTMFWKKMEPFIEEIRRIAYPRAYSETEYLYNALMDYVREHPEIEI